MRFVRECAFLLAALSLAVVPLIGVGCSDQGSPPASSQPSVDLGNKAETKPSAPKSPKKKGRPSDESGSTTGSLGVKPPKVPADDGKK